MPTAPLPTQREALTSLIDSLLPPVTFTLPTERKLPKGSGGDGSGLKLSHLSPEQRKVLLTLHVVFPTLLLPALDLLDRGLVEGVRWVRGGEEGDGSLQEMGRDTDVEGGLGGDEGSVEEQRVAGDIMEDDRKGKERTVVPPMNMDEDERSSGGMEMEMDIDNPPTATDRKRNESLHAADTIVTPRPTKFKPGNIAISKTATISPAPTAPPPIPKRPNTTTSTSPPNHPHNNEYTFFLVHPSTSTTKAWPAAGGGGKTYTIRTKAWNCTCASFIFSAFPPIISQPARRGPGHSSTRERKGEALEEKVQVTDQETAEIKAEIEVLQQYGGGQGQGQGQGQKYGRDNDVEMTDSPYDASAPQAQEAQASRNIPEERPSPPPNQTKEWQFGRLSLEGLAGGDVPCCKHLLACVLAERWPSLLQSYIREKIVSGREGGRAELAGLVVEV